MPVLDPEPTEDGNVRVLNDTGDCYALFDATPQRNLSTPVSIHVKRVPTGAGPGRHGGQRVAVNAGCGR